MSRRALLQGTASLLTAGSAIAASTPSPAAMPPLQAGVRTGAATLAETGFAGLAGQRIGLITNQTGRVGSEHLVDVLAAARQMRLAAILAPEHGFRGQAEAGATVADGRDVKTGVPIFSLYGATKSPTAHMLRGLDAVVFDIQDIGVRFYTYISTMGLAMQAAARHRIPFVVLDRPNPLGGEDVAGFVLERPFTSFVGQYPIPIVHGLTVGELARMIKGEGWLNGLEVLDLKVIRCQGLTRSMRWPETKLPWVATSPNIPSFEAALAYPGIGIVGETLMNEGRGTPTPFSQFGAPWLDAPSLAADLTSAQLPGVRFEPTQYTPRSIPAVAVNPRFLGQDIPAVRLRITNVATYRPLQVGIHALALLQRQARAAGVSILPEKLSMFRAISGTAQLQTLLTKRADGIDIIASWRGAVTRFREQRTPYLLY